MSFEIKFINEKMDGEEVGEITIGDFKETFLVSIDNWNKKRYEEQWVRAIERIAYSNVNINSTLVTSIPDFSKEVMIEHWPLYKIDEVVYMQNHRLDTVPLKESVTDENIYKFIRPRETFSESTSQPISEWQVSLEDLKTWLLSQDA